MKSTIIMTMTITTTMNIMGMGGMVMGIMVTAVTDTAIMDTVVMVTAIMDTVVMDMEDMGMEATNTASTDIKVMDPTVDTMQATVLTAVTVIANMGIAHTLVMAQTDMGLMQAIQAIMVITSLIVLMGRITPVMVLTSITELMGMLIMAEIMQDTARTVVTAATFMVLMEPTVITPAMARTVAIQLTEFTMEIIHPMGLTTMVATRAMDRMPVMHHTEDITIIARMVVTDTGRMVVI
jgi:hypothetical protein